MSDRFEELVVGQEDVIEHSVTADDVDQFVRLIGDTNPVHVNEEYARSTAMKGRVAHGMLAASFLSTMIGTRLPGRGALWVSQTLSFKRPVRIGDRIRIYARVKKKFRSQRILVLDTWVENQHSERVIEGVAEVRVLEEEPAPSEASVGSEEIGVALVTGGGGGIGAAICRRLAEDGFRVGVNFRSSGQHAAEVVQRIRARGGFAIAVQGDVRDEGDVTRMIGEIEAGLGQVTLLVNNASLDVRPRRFADVDWSEMLAHLEVQLRGAYLCSQAVLPGMLLRKTGQIINIGSVYVDGVPPPRLYGYVAAKYALVGLTRSLAVEYGPSGIRVNMVSPGMTDTRLVADVPEKTRLITAMQTPLRRIGRPEDVAAAVAFLARPEAAFLSGEVIRVSGGFVMV